MRTASADKLNALKGREELQAKALAEFKTLSESFDGKFWELIKERLVIRADVYAKSREDRFFDLSEVQLKTLKAREEELRFIVNVPQDIIKSYRELVKQNKELKEEIRSYERRIRNGI